MAATDFFVNWELWQKLTFVLAGSIVVVFLIGLLKLWRMSRFLKKHTILDEEKRARQAEMQKSGLPPRRRIDIPFGVRAIQSGVQVDGIWISRPGTPVEPNSPDEVSLLSATLEVEGEPKGKGKGKALSSGVFKPATTVAEVQPTPKLTPMSSPIGSFLERGSETDVDIESEPLPQGIPPYEWHPTDRANHSSHLSPDEVHNVNARGRVENRAFIASVETYMPTNASSNSRFPTYSRNRLEILRNSSSSDEDDVNDPRSRNVSGVYARPDAVPAPQQSSFEDLEPSSSIIGLAMGGDGPLASVQAGPRTGRIENTSSGRALSYDAKALPQPLLASNRPKPFRKYTGDILANTSTRKVSFTGGYFRQVQ